MKKPLFTLCLLLAIMGFSKQPDNRTQYTRNTSLAEAATDTLLARAYYLQANTFADSFQYDSAIRYYQKASSLYKQSAAWEQYVESYNKIGENFFKKGGYREAENYLQQALATGLAAPGLHTPPCGRKLYNNGNCI